MKKIAELNLGFSDAQNYTKRGNKNILSNIFVRNQYLDNLLDPNIYYLIGEKGTGKTAYATFLSNSEYKGLKATLKFIAGTDYEKFYELKKKGQIDISGYNDIWQTILFLLLAKSVVDDQSLVALFNKSNLTNLMQGIDEYYNSAFSPEIVNALKIVDKSEVAAKLICDHVELGGDVGQTVEFNKQRLQMNLYYICQQFSKAFSNLKLTKDLVLFIDGIDVRPSQIPYDEYLECIKGLVSASWYLNTELFSNVRDSKGQVRIVLLLRPDIFSSLNLQNETNKLVDNAVYLEWRTTYKDYPSSSLYKMANKLLSYDQDEGFPQDIWEYYFKWKLQTSNKEQRKYDTAFMEFLKISLSRPRDIQRILKILQDLMKERNMGGQDKFSFEVYDSDRFQNMYSEYFLSSLKDQLSFYYSEEEYRHFKKFFDFFGSPEFSYNQYLTVHSKYVASIKDENKSVPPFVEDPKSFLQLLYDSNIIAAIDERGFFHFSYREKGPANIAPEVPYERSIRYIFHYGLYKKTKMGRYGGAKLDMEL